MADGGMVKKLINESVEEEIVYSFDLNDCHIVFSDERPNGFNQINLQRIDVDEKGKGTGTLCMDNFIEYVKNNYDVDGIMLNPETVRNQSFYKRFGFKMNEYDLMFLTF